MENSLQAPRFGAKGTVGFQMFLQAKLSFRRNAVIRILSVLWSVLMIESIFIPFIVFTAVLLSSFLSLRHGTGIFFYFLTPAEFLLAYYVFILLSAAVTGIYLIVQYRKYKRHIRDFGKSFVLRAYPGALGLFFPEKGSRRRIPFEDISEAVCRKGILFVKQSGGFFIPLSEYFFVRGGLCSFACLLNSRLPRGVRIKNIRKIMS